MELFSQRQGIRPAKRAIQLDSMNSELRNTLWNALGIYYLSGIRGGNVPDNEDRRLLCRKLWHDYFKQPIDTIPYRGGDAYRQIRDYYFSCKWFEVYDFMEFMANNYHSDLINKDFVEYCNPILERELSGYRFIGTKLVPITSEEEIAEIEEVLDSRESLQPVVIHIQTALEKLSDRKSPDYRNSIKESISAVEAICILITHSDKATLGQALKVITKEVGLHKALTQAFSSIYGYTSDAEGIRHALLDEPDLGFEDAKFMLVSCSAFINYLKLKASKAGIKLETR